MMTKAEIIELAEHLGGVSMDADTVDQYFTDALEEIGKLPNPPLVDVDMIALDEYPDLTTYTEVDVGADRLSVDSSTKVSVTALDNDESAYLYKDYGVAYFDGGFVSRFHMKWTTATGSPFNAALLNVFASGIGSFDELWDADQDMVGINFKSADAVQIIEIDAGTTGDTSGLYTVSTNTDYYCELLINGRTVTLSLYSDSGYSTLIGSAKSITLTRDYNLRYHYPVMGYDSLFGGAVLTGFVQNCRIVYPKVELPDRAVRLLHSFYDDEHLSPTPLRDLESYDATWRKLCSEPRAVTQHEESSRTVRLVPAPSEPTGNFSFPNAAPYGEDYPAYAYVPLFSERRTSDIPEWLGVYLALRINAREFARPSDHYDRRFSKAAAAVANLVYKAAGMEM